MRSKYFSLALITLLACFSTSQATAAGAAAEIEFLLNAIGQSECIFTRNGSDHSSAEAEAHLRMKYNRTRSRIRSAEDFIDRLASESSWTGTAYTISCVDGKTEPSRQWLYRELQLYRRADAI